MSATELGLPRATFRGGGEFLLEVRQEVRRFLAESGLEARARRQLVIKTIVGTLVLALSWIYLVFGGVSLALSVPGFIGLLFGATVVSVCIMHDANHGAVFPRSKRKTHLLGWGIDLSLGFSSYAWRAKHELHHAFPNVDGCDDDIAHEPVFRVAPSQTPRRWYRFQHLYIWPLYATALIRWHITDLKVLRYGRSSSASVVRPKGWHLVGLIAGKALFITWALVVPMVAGHRWWVVTASYCAFTMTGSIFMAIIFQIAHCGEEAVFLTEEDLRWSEHSWAVHEVESTADFCHGNPALTWIVGGLNYQIEHHLFPKLPHPVYPHIAPLIRGVAKRHAVRYTLHATLTEAIRSHYRHLRRMGRLGLPVDIEMG